MNELIFVLHCAVLSLINLVAVHFSKSLTIAVIAIYTILANLFILKQISLFGIDVTASDCFIVGISLALNLLQERYSKKSAVQAVYVSFFGLLVYTILSQFQLWYTPNTIDHAHTHFAALLNCTPRLGIASAMAYFISQIIDVYLYAWLRPKIRWGLVTNYLSTAISQLADTSIFTIVGLFGTGFPLLNLIIFSYFIKLIAIAISILAISFMRKMKNL